MNQNCDIPKKYSSYCQKFLVYLFRIAQSFVFFAISLFSFSFRAGRWSNIRFWEDYWVGERSLSESFPLLFILSSFKEKKISDFVVRVKTVVGTLLIGIFILSGI